MSEHANKCEWPMRETAKGRGRGRRGKPHLSLWCVGREARGAEAARRVVRIYYLDSRLCNRRLRGDLTHTAPQ